ncbi:MAG: hypothetical protein DWQ01_06305 [Planctomycetota bacterium]|nr:MAG: hypothetical protein DWQ01_06305 [Planctomycetota bacterium]
MAASWKQRFRLQTGLALVSLLAWSACNPPPAPPNSAPPQRVVVLGPSTAESLIALGLQDRLVGVSDYCLAPEAQHLPKLGGQLNPSTEALAALRPDLVITQGSFPRLQTFLSGLGIENLAFATDSWSAWREEILLLGDRFQVESRSQDLLEAKERQLAAVRKTVAGKTPVRTVLVVSRKATEISGLVVVGGSSFLHEMLEAAGGRNAFAENSSPYFDLNEEALIRAAPDCILEFDPSGSAPEKNKALELWSSTFPQLPAVQSGKIFLMKEDFLMLPGPRMPAIAAAMAERLHLPAGEEGP